MKKLIYSSYVFLIVALSQTSCIHSENDSFLKEDVSEYESAFLKVLAFGNGGFGTQTRKDVAFEMKKICYDQGCDMGIMLGNMVPKNKTFRNGSLAKSFNRIYGSLHIKLYNANGLHEANKKQDIFEEFYQNSNWWEMPSSYYDFKRGDIHFFSLDTVDFSDAQKQWLEDKLERSDALWKVVYGHHPIISFGKKGNNPELVGNLLSVLCEYADLYVASHELDQQVIQSECGLPMIISGTASKTHKTGKGAGSLFSGSQPGFSRLEFKKNSISYNVYGLSDKRGSAKIIHSGTFNRRE